jgi:hypothetical protein
MAMTEDIDLSFHREFLGFGPEEHDPESAASNKERRRRIESLQDACRACVAGRLRPDLEGELAERLGDGENWLLEIDPGDPQTLLFHYPQAGGSGPEYIRPAVKIEMGARSDHWPKERREIVSYIGETLGEPIGVAGVHALGAERTFWEKSTLLHAECHRPADKPMPARYARHFHDLARLANEPVAAKALEDAALRRRVVEHKTVYFRSSWARYDLAAPGAFRLVPDEARMAELKHDAEAMAEMFFSPPPPLDEVLETLRELEARINALEE